MDNKITGVIAIEFLESPKLKNMVDFIIVRRFHQTNSVG
jgi:hypothetical protein